MNHATHQRKKCLRVHLESIVAAARAIDEEMRTMPHPQSLARQSLMYKKESIIHEHDGSFKATYRARDGKYYTIAVQYESQQQAFFFEGGLLQNVSGKAL